VPTGLWWLAPSSHNDNGEYIVVAGRTRPTSDEVINRNGDGEDACRRPLPGGCDLSAARWIMRNWLYIQNCHGTTVHPAKGRRHCNGLRPSYRGPKRADVSSFSVHALYRQLSWNPCPTLQPRAVVVSTASAVVVAMGFGRRIEGRNAPTYHRRVTYIQ
jgi:hypothetical protein